MLTGINVAQCPQLHHIHYENRSFWANAAGDIVTDLMSECGILLCLSHALTSFSSFDPVLGVVEH